MTKPNIGGTMADESTYHFSTVLAGHAKDVRAIVAIGSPVAFVTGSRDNTAKLWVNNNVVAANQESPWKEQASFAEHKGFVSSVAYKPPNDAHPEGIIYTGCHDGHIRAFHPSSPSPIMEVEAHNNTVSSLFVSRAGTLLSGSWDWSAKVWVDSLKCVMTLSGHEDSVWAVAVMPECGVMLTASADTSVRLWLAGACKSTLSKAHDMAVRDLAVVSNSKFLSCGNDGYVKMWNVEVIAGGNVKATPAWQILAHDNFIYSLCVIHPESETWAIAGEYSGIRIFSKDQLRQALPLPATSVWGITTSSNGDVAAACSDAKVWIFSAEKSRWANDELTTNVYEQELTQFQRPAATSSELEGIDTASLPGPEALLQPGRREGQTKLIKKGEEITAYTWSQAVQEWKALGVVVGAPGGSTNGAAPGGGRVMYDGKEYDFVFDVDIEDGIVLKLPYNRGQEPYQVAQEFIHKHELPQDYLISVAEFIYKNSGQSNKSYGTATNPDPFTGGGSHTSNGDSASSGTQYFPQEDFVSFVQAPKFDALTSRLKDNNDKVPDELKLSASAIERLHLLCLPDKDIAADDIVHLLRALGWPGELTVPALDVLRLAVLNPRAGGLLLNPEIIDKLISLVLRNMETPSDTCRMLAARTLANMFSNSEGLKVLLKLRESVVARLMNLIPAESKNAQVAISTAMLNFSVATSRAGDEEGQSQCISAIAYLLLTSLTDAEAQFRTLVALGTLLKTSSENVALAKGLSAANAVLLWRKEAESAGSNSNSDKLRDCARSILGML